MTFRGAANGGAMKLSMTPLWDLLYPRRCAACRLRGEWLCAACLLLCVEHGEGCCSRCGSRLRGSGCASCGRYIRHLDEIHAAYDYSGPVRELVHRFKYDNISAAAPWMADRMPVDWLPGNAVLIPVPLHSARERERGYNQSELLARAIGKRTGLRVSPALRRIRQTLPQAHQDAASRWTNVSDAFELRGKCDVGGPVVLVDDVCTTGATLEECAAVLTRMGASSVSALVFARA